MYIFHPLEWLKGLWESWFKVNMGDLVSEAFHLPVSVANEPYLRSFKYKVWNSILFTNDRLCKIGYISEPNCTFCHQLTETIPHILFGCSFSNFFWHEVNEKILSQIKICRSLSLTYCEVMYQSNRSFHIPPGNPPGHLNFWKNFVQIPPSPGRKAVQMPHPRENYRITVLTFQ